MHSCLHRRLGDPVSTRLHYYAPSRPTLPAGETDGRLASSDRLAGGALRKEKVPMDSHIVAERTCRIAGEVVGPGRKDDDELRNIFNHRAGGKKR